MAATTVKNRLNDLIGSFVSELSSELELICSAFNEVIDSCPNKLLIKYSDDNTACTSASPTFATEGYKIILVTRKDANSKTRVCNEISFLEGEAAADSNSIYFVDGDQDRMPSWYIAPNGNLTILPAPSGVSGAAGSANVYWFDYFKPQDTTSILDMKLYDDDDAISLESSGYPHEAVQAACLKSAINIINAKISLAVQEEEDAELLTLLRSQAEALIASYNAEIKRIQEVAE